MDARVKPAHDEEKYLVGRPRACAIPRAKGTAMPLSNLATRDIETLVHPYINLAAFRDSLGRSSSSAARA